MQHSVGFLSILPPVLVLFLGFTTKKVIPSLFCGILLAALISQNYGILDSLVFVTEKCWQSMEVSVFFNPNTFWQSWNAFICVFLFVLGIFITLLHHSGGAHAYKTFIHKKLSNKKHVESSSLILSKCLCIDDYFSSLTVGSVMHPITDSYKVPRAKLAFLVDAMAAPLTVLCPVSSWVAAIVGFLRDNGVHSQISENTMVVGSPFVAYLQIIPYILYSFVIISGAWIIVLFGFSFGQMGKHEAVAEKTGNVFNGKKAPKSSLSSTDSSKTHSASLLDFFLPVLLLIAGVVFGILQSGNYFDTVNNVSFIEALRDASAAQGLFIGGLFSLIFTIIFFLARKKLSLRELPKLCFNGSKLMATSCFILILAWTLGGILRQELGTGQYLAGLMTGRLALELIPMMFFIASVMTAFALGSAWATAAVMFPIAVQLVISLSGVSSPASFSELAILFPTLGAILSGCVAGDHISPISDTTIMSSTSTAMEHGDHVTTQLSYAVPLIAICALGYLLLGYLLPFGSLIAISVSIFVSILNIYFLFYLLNRYLPKAKFS